MVFYYFLILGYVIIIAANLNLSLSLSLSLSLILSLSLKSLSCPSQVVQYPDKRKSQNSSATVY